MTEHKQTLHGKPNMPAYSLDLHHRAFPELAAALRASTEPILSTWRELALQEMPHLGHYTLDQFQNDLRIIFESVAVSLESGDPEQIRSLIESAPQHGFERFLNKGNLLDLFIEERILRGVMVVAIEKELGRPMKTDEAATLHATIDVMIQQGVLAMVQNQKDELREAAERELKFLAFFSHDLNNHLFVINSSLQGLSHELQGEERYRAARDLLDMALRSIKHASDGTRRLLQHARMRSSTEPVFSTFNLHDLFSQVASLWSSRTEAKNMRILIDVAPDATVQTDPDLLSIILQNLVGNAVKHCQCAEVRLAAQPEGTDHQQQWRISVADDGQGIEPDQLERIFQAFQRGKVRKTGAAEGVGLGLAIVSQAAKLLNATIEVDSRPGQGTTFKLLLPPPA